MYDWITASFNITEIPYQRFVSNIIQISEVKNFFTNTTWANGYLTNNKTGRKMGVSVSEKRIKIKICPNKFILGNNAQEAPIEDIFNTMYDLSNQLGIDLGNFILEQLDVTHTAITEYVPEMYFPYLCNTNGFNRWQLDTSLYYDGNSANVQKVFYDKVKEVDKRKTWGGRQHLPDDLKGKNLTRFECRLGSNAEIVKVIGKKASLGQLFSEEHIDQLQDWWLKQYETIPKTTELEWNFKKDMGQKAVDETINHLGLMSLGRLQIEELIELASKQGAYKHPSQKTASKKKLLGMFEMNGKKHELIKELDIKFRNTEPKWD